MHSKAKWMLIRTIRKRCGRQVSKRGMIDSALRIEVKAGADMRLASTLGTGAAAMASGRLMQHKARKEKVAASLLLDLSQKQTWNWSMESVTSRFFRSHLVNHVPKESCGTMKSKEVHAAPLVSWAMMMENMKENTVLQSREEGSMHGLMEESTEATGTRIRSADSVHTSGQISGNIKENGSSIRWMESANSRGLMGKNTSASSKTTTRMVMVSTSKQMVTFIVEIGKTGAQTAWASITSMIKEDNMASGRAAR